MAENTDQQAVSASGGKPSRRSAAYPAITIEQAITFVADVYKNFRSVYAKRDDILAVTEAKHPRYLAAAAYYLLLDRENDTYKVAEHYKLIATPLNEKERAIALLASFGAPKLYKTLIEKFDGGVVPPELPFHLSRFHEITDEAAPLAAEIFIKNAKYCGVLSEMNVLTYKTTLMRLNESPSDAQIGEQGGTPILPSTPGRGEGTVQDPGYAYKTGQKLLPEMVNEEKVRIRLTGGRFAYLIHPLDLSTVDIQILQKEIEKLQLIAGSV
jgi:hypothetical protein